MVNGRKIVASGDFLSDTKNSSAYILPIALFLPIDYTICIVDPDYLCNKLVASEVSEKVQIRKKLFQYRRKKKRNI